jgi:hypothetical protein
MFFAKTSSPGSIKITPVIDFMLQYEDADTDKIVKEKSQDAVMIRAREGEMNELITPRSTRSGRLVVKPQQYREAGAFAAKQDYFDVDKFHELTCVGAGIGGGFINTKELHVMNY